MSDPLIIAPILLPMAAACLGLLWPRRVRPLSVVAGFAIVLLTAARCLTFGAGGAASYALGNWPAPYGIALTADAVSAWMLLATAWTLFGVQLFAASARRDTGAFFHPLFFVLWTGLNGAFLTGDVFNLFVFFEVLLTGSYGIALQAADAARARVTLRYVGINLAGSAVFLIAAGMLYGVAGSLNFADLGVRIGGLTGTDRALALAGVALLAVVFLLKGAAMPLSAWLPETYARIVPVSAAAFTLLTKLGAYGLLRINGYWSEAFAGWPLLEVVRWLGIATMLLAGIGALGSLSLRAVASWSVLASSGFLMLVFSTRDPALVAAGLFYLPVSAASASALYLAGDLATRGQLGGTARLWLLAAAAGVAGLPPLAGFLAKLQAVSGLLAGGAGWAVAAIVVSGLCVLVGLARAGLRCVDAGGRTTPGVHLALCWLCGAGIAMSLFAAPLQLGLKQAAEALVQDSRTMVAASGAGRELRP